MKEEDAYTPDTDVTKNTTLHIIRHGESLGNASPDTHCTHRHCDIPLTQTGKEQAFTLGRVVRQERKGYFHMPINVVYSPYDRARQTALHFLAGYLDMPEIVEANNNTLSRLVYPQVNIYMCPALREHEWSDGSPQADWTIAAYPDLQRQYGMNEFRFPNGENGFDVIDRLMLWFPKIDRLTDNAGDTFLFTHLDTGAYLKAIVESYPDGFPDFTEASTRSNKLENCGRHIYIKQPKEQCSPKYIHLATLPTPETPLDRAQKSSPSLTISPLPSPT